MYLTKYESSYRCIICYLFGLSRHLPSPRVKEKKKLKNLKRKEKKNQRKYCLTKLKTRKQVSLMKNIIKDRKQMNRFKQTNKKIYIYIYIYIHIN